MISETLLNNALKALCILRLEEGLNIIVGLLRRKPDNRTRTM